MYPPLVAMLVLVALAVLVSLRRVPQDRAFTVHRFGRFSRSLGPGVHVVLPLVERIGHRVVLIGHQVQLHADQGATQRDAAVFYQILEPERTGACLDAVDDYVKHEADAIFAEVMTQGLETATGFGDRLQAELNRRLSPQGLRVTRCRLQLA
jgi:regulator of protease activity HflC (stomatin/prohibitin superfamily)